MLRCVDLFAGAGGFSMAAKQAGLSPVLAVDNDRHAIATYRRNICAEGTQNPLVIEGDIREMDARELKKKAVGAKGSCDLLLGGPPCQGFSTHRIKDAGVGDERNALIHVYFEFVREFRPSAFLMENVPGMLWPRHKAYLNRFYREAENSEYSVFKPVLIDARDYGVPQRRKRVFILGVRSDLGESGLAWPPQPTHGNEKARLENPALLPWVSCSTAFRKSEKGDPNNRHMKHSEELIAAFRSTPKNGGSRKDSGRVLDCHKSHDGHKDVYGRIDPRLPAPTMTTACINPSKGRFVHPTQHHGITLRQAARIQTFPDNFVFEGGLIAAGQQIGNAVPVQLGVALINSLKNFLIAASASPLKNRSQRQRRAA